jgi:uncharacterized protein
MVKFSFLPTEPKFSAFFEQQSGNIVKMARQLNDVLYVWQNVKERVDIISDMEQDGDAITHDIMKLLHRTFVTPFDREDIVSLTQSLDDVADLIHEVADTIVLYRIKSPTEMAKKLSDVILKAVLEVEAGVSDVQSKKGTLDLVKRCATIHQIEKSGNIVYRTALSDLFKQPDDLVFVIKWQAIYKKMEKAINVCENCADVLEGIAIECY